jgi:hypothetical protein
MFIVILLLSLILAFLIAYTMNMQGTTLALGRLLVSKSVQDAGTGVQDAITPKSQTVRNIGLLALLVIVFGLTTYAYAWYHGLWVLVASFLASYILTPIIGIKAGSPRLVAAIASDMKRRHQNFLSASDTVQAQAIEELIDRLEQLSSEDILHEARR